MGMLKHRQPPNFAQNNTLIDDLQLNIRLYCMNDSAANLPDFHNIHTPHINEFEEETNTKHQ